MTVMGFGEIKIFQDGAWAGRSPTADRNNYYINNNYINNYVSNNYISNNYISNIYISNIYISNIYISNIYIRNISLHATQGSLGNKFSMQIQGRRNHRPEPRQQQLHIFDVELNPQADMLSLVVDLGLQVQGRRSRGRGHKLRGQVERDRSDDKNESFISNHSDVRSFKASLFSQEIFGIAIEPYNFIKISNNNDDDDNYKIDINDDDDSPSSHYINNGMNNNNNNNKGIHDNYIGVSTRNANNDVSPDWLCTNTVGRTRGSASESWQRIGFADFYWTKPSLKLLSLGEILMKMKGNDTNYNNDDDVDDAVKLSYDNIFNYVANRFAVNVNDGDDMIIKKVGNVGANDNKNNEYLYKNEKKPVKNNYSNMNNSSNKKLLLDKMADDLIKRKLSWIWLNDEKSWARTMYCRYPISSE
ncbi:hypothetical protein HELRODRAFT_181762 [Helobdella robusta]|uniref:Uncharacterized protein n=1 Tax=Helobdella robusta TaxID=6412 RepID=T1FHA7_HELRO|nr:hypothetical protein HELRODRAFT_181762 [Helobdella robusta]ESN92142.1 hypothetical protein HELRODRAFT_181762 [Helobdella robusta]